MKWSLRTLSPETRRRALVCAGVVLLAFTVRALTAQFIGRHITDPAWFPYGIYAIFDNQAQDILDGKADAFWAGDALSNPRAATTAVYPPGYSLWLAFIYRVTGSRSVLTVQAVQVILDSLSVLLIIGVGLSAFGWRAGIWAGLLSSLSPLLAFYGATPLADAPTAWVVLAGAWMFVLAAKRGSWRWALGAGLLIGASFWLRANALLLGVWCALAFLLFVKASWKSRALVSGVFFAGVLALVVPVIVRNSIAFRAFVPGGMGVGTNLWEGLGETSRAEEFGAVFGDANLIKREREEYGISPEAQFELYWPNGLERDRARMSKAVSVIKAHPVWFAGVMLRRMAGMLKYAGEPAPYVGTAGINVTSKKCLADRWQGGVIAAGVNLLGMAQSIMRYALLPLMLIGAFYGFRKDWRTSALIMTVVLYYLIVGSPLHTELRYGLPMQALLFVFAGLAIVEINGRLRSKLRSGTESSGPPKRHESESD